MLCRFVPFFISVCLFLILPVFTANAQRRSDRNLVSSTSNTEPTPLPSASVTISKDVTVEADISDLQLQLLKRPNDAITLNNLATKYVQLGQLEKALGILERSVDSNDRLATTHLNLGNVYDRLGRYNDAMQAVNRAVHLDPLNAGSRSYLCELEMLTERNSEAVECYRTYFGQFESTPTFRANFGVALMRAGDLEESVSVLRKVAAEFPKVRCKIH